MSEILDIQGVAKLAQDIFPEVSGSAWSMSVASSGEHFIMGAVFDRRMRMEVILQHGEWAICRIFVKKEDAARTENEVERTVIKPTEDNFIGWFSSVRSQCPLPQDFLFLHRNGDNNLFRHDPDPQNDLVGHVLHVSVDYKKVTFKARLQPQFKTTPEQIRYLMAKGCIVPWGARVSPCEGCAKPHCSKRDQVNDPDCFVVEEPPSHQPTLQGDWRPIEDSTGTKKSVTMKELWDKPPEPLARGARRKVPCGRCLHGRPIKSNSGDWDWFCDKGNYPQRDCDDFDPKATKSGPRPRPSCPQCAHYDARPEFRCKKGRVNNAPNCNDFKWAGIAPGSTSSQAAEARDCRNCKNYGGTGICYKDEALGTAPVCNEYEAKPKPAKKEEQRSKQCPACKHLEQPGRCAKMCSPTALGPCSQYEYQPRFRFKYQCAMCIHGVKAKTRSGDWEWGCDAKLDPEDYAPCPRFKVDPF